MQENVKFAIDVVYEAGKRIRHMMQEDIKVEEKTSKSDLVTNVDKQTEAFIVAKIQERYEGQNFLTEESTVDMHGSDHLWIIDPIDGTTNFIYQKQHFSISVAVPGLRVFEDRFKDPVPRAFSLSAWAHSITVLTDGPAPEDLTDEENYTVMPFLPPWEDRKQEKGLMIFLKKTRAATLSGRLFVPRNS